MIQKCISIFNDSKIIKMLETLIFLLQVAYLKIVYILKNLFQPVIIDNFDSAHMVTIIRGISCFLYLTVY